jgi:hypothetical protein
MQRLENGDVSERAVRRVCCYHAHSHYGTVQTDQFFCQQQIRNTPARVLTEFPIVEDVALFRAILGVILSMHAPYPEYSPPELDDKNLSPAVDPTVYPICAGKWQLAGRCQLYLYGDDLPIEVSRLLETFMDVVDPKETEREIA